MVNIANSVTDLIGKTPILELKNLTRNIEGRILAKIEYFNPGFSKKDRIALQTIQDAEEAGLLTPGQTIIELTSGNTGTGYSIVCKAKGYKFIAVMSKGNSIERAKMMQAFGAEVILVDQAPGSELGQVSGDDLKLVEIEAQRLTKELNAFRADQFQLDGNWRAHYYQTAHEIIEQTGGKIDGFCDFVGSAGSYVGITKRLKEYNSSIKTYIVEPQTAAILAGEQVTNANHKIQGGGYSMNDLKFLQNTPVDGYIQISDDEAKTMCKRLASEEGIFAGFSSGANVAAAMQLLQTEMRGRTIICLLPDSGLKYLSTDLWD